MTSLAAFFDMGGYAAFVWTAYALTALVMVAVLFTSLQGLRDRQRRLAGLEALRPRRDRARSGNAADGDADRQLTETPGTKAVNR